MWPGAHGGEGGGGPCGISTLFSLLHVHVGRLLDYTGRRQLPYFGGAKKWKSGGGEGGGGVDIQCSSFSLFLYFCSK